MPATCLDVVEEESSADEALEQKKIIKIKPINLQALNHSIPNSDTKLLEQQKKSV